jgi:hypothetical protein
LLAGDASLGLGAECNTCGISESSTGAKRSGSLFSAEASATLSSAREHWDPDLGFAAFLGGVMLAAPALHFE